MNPEGVRLTVSVSLVKHLTNETRIKILYRQPQNISPDRCNTLLEWQRKRITRDGCKEYTLTRNCKKGMKEPEDFHRLKTSNAFIIVLTSGACISPYKNRLYT